MKKIIVIAAVFIAAAAGIYFGFFNKEETQVVFKTAKVERKSVVQTIEATGTVEPEELVDVGARVSGEIVSFGKDKNGKEVDYGSEIAEGSLIALIDDTIPQSNLLSAKARFEQAKASQTQSNANLVLAQTNLKQAERDWNRAKRLGVSEALSQSSYDSYLSGWEKATAEIDVAKAKILQSNAEVAQAEAGMKEAQRNLDYCVIRAPVSGVVIDRKINVGQTVVSNMSASSLFLIAKDLKRMEVWASVNEADIGGIRQGQPVSFTVDAFPGENFKGSVGKIRLNATMSQNVVTYVVEVTTDNSNGRLLPYLSANLSFEVARKDKVLAVPNSALNFTPSEDQIEFPPENKEAGEARKERKKEKSEDGESVERKRGDRVWVLTAEGKVRRVKVKAGISDNIITAIESSELKEGDLVVTGTESLAQSSSTTNPFVPKLPQRGRRR